MALPLQIADASELQRMTENGELYGGDEYATLAEYPAGKQKQKNQVVINYQKPFLRRMMNVDNMAAIGKRIPEQWLDKGKIYGRVKRMDKNEYEIEKKRLVSAFNHDAYYKITKKFIENNEIIDIPYYADKKNYHRIHYLPKYTAEWYEAYDNTWEHDINTDDLCGICKMMQEDIQITDIQNSDSD